MSDLEQIPRNIDTITEISEFIHSPEYDTPKLSDQLTLPEYASSRSRRGSFQNIFKFRNDDSQNTEMLPGRSQSMVDDAQSKPTALRKGSLPISQKLLKKTLFESFRVSSPVSTEHTNFSTSALLLSNLKFKPRKGYFALSELHSHLLDILDQESSINGPSIDQLVVFYHAS